MSNQDAPTRNLGKHIELTTRMSPSTSVIQVYKGVTIAADLGKHRRLTTRMSPGTNVMVKAPRRKVAATQSDAAEGPRVDNCRGCGIVGSAAGCC